MKTLIFEGAGWDIAESSKATDVGNCRIRTRIRNNRGRVIYLEMSSGHFDKKAKHIPEYAIGLEYVMFIDFVYYSDAKWDNRRCFSKAFSSLKDTHFEYNKANILKFVNDNLDCSFDNMIVCNDGSIFVHSSNEPLCDSSNGDYEPYKDIEINISELDGINPAYSRESCNFANYKISYNSLMKLPYMKRYFEGRGQSEIKKIQQGDNRACFRWDKEGTITDLELDAGVHVSVSAEDVQKIIDLVKADNLQK